jgi:hypothetical protein
LFGAVSPATVETEALIAPCVDKNIMTHHLEHISAKAKTGRHALVIMDGPGRRSSKMASSVIGGRYQQREYLNVAPVFTGAKPIERVGSWLRQHHLANRCFSGYDDIVEVCSIAWIDFVSDAKCVTKMCSRDGSK